MNLDNLNKWLTLAANLGVIAGIVFLGVELNQNNELMQAEAKYRLFENRKSSLIRALESPETAYLEQKIRSGQEMTDEERSLTLLSNMEILFNWEWEYGEYQSGRLAYKDLPVDAYRYNSRQRQFFKEAWDNFKIRISNDTAFIQFMETEVLR